MRFMFPEGVKAMVEAVDMIASGDYPKTVQPAEGATYDPIWKKKECGKIDWAKMDTALKVRFTRYQQCASARAGAARLGILP